MATPLPCRPRRREEGIALITVMLVLALVGTIAVSAIDRSDEELQAGGRARATTKVVFAADAGVQLGLRRVVPPRDLSSFDFNLADGTNVQSRARDEVGAQPLEHNGFGKPPEGYSINVGSGFVNEVFQLNVTSSGPGGSMAEIETKIGMLTSNAGGL